MSSQSNSFILVSGSDAATGKTPAASGQGQRVEWAHKLRLLQPPSLFIFFHKTGTWYLLNYCECLLLGMTKFCLSQCALVYLQNLGIFLIHSQFTYCRSAHLKTQLYNNGKLTFREWPKAFKRQIIVAIDIKRKKRKPALLVNDKWLTK